MRYMIIVKATRESEAGVMPEEKLLQEMGAFHDEMAKAGILRDASGLKPSSRGWRVKYDGKETTFVDGPFSESQDLVAGYTIIEVGSREDAIAWTRRFPNPAVDGGSAEIEVREFFDLDDFGDSEAVKRFKTMEDQLRPDAR